MSSSRCRFHMNCTCTLTGHSSASLTSRLCLLLAFLLSKSPEVPLSPLLPPSASVCLVWSDSCFPRRRQSHNKWGRWSDTFHKTHRWTSHWSWLSPFRFSLSLLAACCLCSLSQSSITWWCFPRTLSSRTQCTKDAKRSSYSQAPAAPTVRSQSRTASFRL